ncbi:SdiA-regulated domain-containing protein [Mucilaginibacter aquaedulcis]|uniref:SdiA-regulated domain-containing protein n=1 Tax=Mucilaginibacter aquaedulcis TaxID=1187081 RepID=UPI0025B4EBDD|nr:SdiA-regulated domain-containing protein [Mucilaginibacter aquaedulcis]MDN3548130.1 SdiA-regulated domain-containing protein [Mucilaginibacter aquaedulcis]
MRKIISPIIVMLVVVGVLLGISCKNNSEVIDSPKGYDLSKPVKYNMHINLTEISGIAFRHGKNDSLYAEEDEDGKVYYLKLGDKKVSESRFAKSGDYEDIAICNDYVIMLKSDGTLFTFLYNKLRNKDIPGVNKIKNVLPTGEYEGMYADEKTNRIYVLCKQCDDDKKKRVSGYILQLQANGTVKQAGGFGIDVKAIEQQAGKKIGPFRPSALAKNTNTNEWYILSSVNKLLVITDANWIVKTTYPLKPSLFLQPEGIAFDNQHNLYISNEGDLVSAGNVLKFNYIK